MTPLKVMGRTAGRYREVPCTGDSSSTGPRGPPAFRSALLSVRRAYRQFDRHHRERKTLIDTGAGNRRFEVEFAAGSRARTAPEGNDRNDGATSSIPGAVSVPG